MDGFTHRMGMTLTCVILHWDVDYHRVMTIMAEPFLAALPPPPQCLRTIQLIFILFVLGRICELKVRITGWNCDVQTLSSI